MLESNAVSSIGQQLRKADAAERKQLMIHIRDSYSAVGRKLSAVMQLAVAWAQACEGHSLSAQAPLASVLGKHLTRLLMPSSSHGSTRVIHALLTSPALQQGMPAGLTSPALTGVLASLARRFADSESRGVLDHILTTAHLWGHLPVAVPHILLRQPELLDHTKAVTAVVAASLAAQPATPPPSTAYSMSLASPEVRLHLPAITAVFAVLVARGVHEKLLEDPPDAPVLPSQAAPALCLMERLAHVLAGDEMACSAGRRLGLPPLQAVPPGAYPGARALAIGRSCTPLGLLQAHLLRDKGRNMADWPCGASWTAAAKWVLSVQDSWAGGAGGGASDPPGQQPVNCRDEFKQGLVALGACSAAGAELTAAAALTTAAAVAMHRVAATALLLFPPPRSTAVRSNRVVTNVAFAETSSVWLERSSGLQVASAAKADALAAAVLLHGTRGCFLVPEVAQSQPWKERVHSLLEFIPQLCSWHPALRAPVCDVVCDLVSHLSQSRGDGADGSSRAFPSGADNSDSRPLGAIAVAAQRALLAVSEQGGLSSVAGHLCLPCWNRCKEFAMVTIRNILRDNAQDLSGNALRRVLLALSVSRGSGGDSCWGSSMAQAYPHSMASLYQMVVTHVNVSQACVVGHTGDRGADGRTLGDAALWEAAGILSHGTTPWAFARQLWETLSRIVSPCSVIE